MPGPIRRRTWEKTTASVDDAKRPDNAAPEKTHPASPFFSIPTVVLTGVGLFPPFSSTVGRHVCNLTSHKLELLQGASYNPARHLLEALLTTSNDSIVVHIWAVLQASVFRHKTLCSTVPYFCAAVVLNHARRTFWSGNTAVGFFVLPQPDEDWRMLLARPDVFLEDMVKAVRGGGLVVAAVQKRVCDVLAGGLMAALAVADETALTQAAPSRASRVARTAARRAKDVAAIIFVVWLFSCIEYAVAQASATLAVGSAFWQLSQKQPGLLVNILFGGGRTTTGWVLMLAWMQMAVYPWTGLVPLVVQSVARPQQPGVFLCLLFLVVAMDTLLRYRSRLYIAIETSGLFVFLGFAAISVLMAVGGCRTKAKRQ